MPDLVYLAAVFLDPNSGEHTCQVQFASLDDIVILSDATPAIDASIVCHVDGLGVLRGTVGTFQTGGFSLRLCAGQLHRDRLAGRLRWHPEKASGRADLRHGARVVPDWPAVAVMWPGSVVAGMLRDISASGAAIDLAPRPSIGTPVTLGRRRGTVVRHTEAGVGVRLAMPLRPEDVTESVVF